MDERDESVRDGIAKTYAADIAACERLREQAQSMFREWPGNNLGRGHDGLLASLFVRSFNTFTAVVGLARRGHGAQAAMLNRSLFEDMLDAHWIATEPEEAIARYGQHNEHSRMLLADQVAKYPDLLGHVDIPEFDADERESLDAVFGEFGHRPWSGLSSHKRVAAVEHHWASEDERRLLHFFRDIPQRENNQTLHVSAPSLNAGVEKTADGGLAFKVGPQTDRVAQALWGGFWIYAQTTGLMLDEFEVGMAEDERAALFSMSDFYRPSAEDRRNIGRNEPCPCGSGLKFKRCHGG